MKSLLIALSLTALSSVALTAHAGSKDMPQVQEYTYGSKVDIATVTKRPNLSFCGVRPVDLGYVDHMGKAHTLRYETSGNACLGDN
ncbi:DUF2790 domain-containing protein [Pseudomonas sp. NPDC090202]|uniref:DUF2790 domain-containing protein n=1 Tax=unclassified Pseudomonas TaxID=196821 RepID=UPI003829D126